MASSRVDKLIKNMRIKINHIAKIEGHANLIADLYAGRISRARFRTREGARLIEGVLLGRDAQDAVLINPRICGVCPVVHSLATIKAIEAAFRVKPSAKTIILRKILELAQLIHSHALHLVFFTLPDYLKVTSDLELLKKNPELAKAGLAVREYGNRIIEVIGGRSIHPMNCAVGGFIKEPTSQDLIRLLKQSHLALEDAQIVAQTFLKIKLPEFSRKTEYICLSSPKEYAIYDGNLTSTISKKIDTSMVPQLRPFGPEGLMAERSGLLSVNPERVPISGASRRVDLKEFCDKIHEEYSSYNIIKKTKYQDKVYMVGSLARINLNSRNLNHGAKELWKKFNIKLPSFNSFHNIPAQLVEIVHCIEESQKLIREALASRSKAGLKKYQPKAGRGIGAVEAPRGTLIHDYTCDRYGRLIRVNIITPTAQFVNNLEKDVEVLVSKKLSEEKARQELKKLVRAYDPCMTCSTH